MRALEALTRVPGVKRGVQGWWAEWVWGLLVRCEVCLTAEEVAVVRGVGKRALVVRKVLCTGGWKGKEEGDKGSDWDGEEPEGWVEEGGKEKEEGEVEEEGGELERAKEKAIRALMGEQNVYANPDAIDLGLDDGLEDEPGVTVNVSKEALSANPDAINLDAEDPIGTAVPEVKPEPVHEAKPAPAGPVPAVDTNFDTPNPEVGANTTEINIEPIPPPRPAPVQRKEMSLVDTLGALDMVISIVGDFYGQRDLLSEREEQGGLRLV